MPLPGDEDPESPYLDPVIKTGHENRARHERKHKQSDRDIRKLAFIIMQFQMNGRLTERELESLTEIIRRA